MSYQGHGGGGQPYNYGNGGGYAQPNYYHQSQQPPSQPSQRQPQPQQHPVYTSPHQMNGVISGHPNQYAQHGQPQNPNLYYQQPQYNPGNYPGHQQRYHHDAQQQPQQYYPQYTNYQSQPSPQQSLPQLPQLPQLQQSPHVQHYSPQQQQIHIQMPPPQAHQSPLMQHYPPIQPPKLSQQSFDSPMSYSTPISLESQPQRETPVLPPARKAQSISRQSSVAVPSPISRPQSVTKNPVSHNQSQKSSQVVDSKLLMALAEEFFSEAHKIGAASATNLSRATIDTYQKLISTGLGCLETCLLNLVLKPRLQARIRLRFASVMYEETENNMEAELVLTKGISLCEQHKYIDLKYNMQFLLAKILFRSKPKAGMKVLDSIISEVDAYRDTAWLYAFRFLKARLSMSLGKGSVLHAALQSLRSISTKANEHNDRAIYSTASLMEVIAYLSSPGSENSENAQRALAAARTYQLDEGSEVPQIAFLTHCLDVTCSFIYGGPPGDTSAKLRNLQIFMDSAKDNPAWQSGDSVVAIPVGQHAEPTQTVSSDTRAVLDVSEDGRPRLLMSFLAPQDAVALTNLLSAIILVPKDSIEPHKSSQYLRQAHIYLAESKKSRKKGTPLTYMLETSKWRQKIATYAHIYQAFCLSFRSEWAEARKHLDEISHASSYLGENDGPFEEYLIYLKGICYQGSGELDLALDAYGDSRLALRYDNRQTLLPADQVRYDLSILAKLNSLWIVQEASHQNPLKVTGDLANLETLCDRHPDKDLQTALSLVKATVLTDPPASAIKQKNFLQSALQKAKENSNNQFLCMVFSIMYSKFFHGVVGEQAMKSVSTADVFAKKSGNTLWRSVAEGLLAEAHNTHGQTAEAQAAIHRATQLAGAAFGKNL